MANIGTFKKSGNEFQGEIVTLRLQSKGVRIVPETSRVSDNAPSHRVYVDRPEAGAAWSRRSNEGRDYLSVKLDDPSFTAPIYASLFDDPDGDPDLVTQPQAERRAGGVPRPDHRAGLKRLLDAKVDGGNWTEQLCFTSIHGRAGEGSAG